MQDNENQEESVDPLTAALQHAADKAFPDTVEAQDVESVEESDTSTGQEDAEGLQTGLEDTPNAPTAAEHAKAVQLIGRAAKKFGSEPVSITGKSAAEVVALATEFDTLMREADREHGQQPQGESPPDTGDEDPSSTGTAGTETPAKLDALLTSLKEEGLDEAAVQLQELIGGQQAQIDALKASFEGEAQARQLAPIQEAADAVFAGVEQKLPDLSKSQRDGLMTLAAQIGSANPAKYEKMSPAERVQSTLSQAIEVVHSVKAAGPKAKARPAKRKTADPVSGGNKSGGATDTPTTMEECLAHAADKAFEGWDN